MNIRDLTTKDVLRFLPMDKEVRAHLLKIYPDGVPYKEGVRIEELAWDLFYEYFEMIYQSLLKREIMHNPPGQPLSEGYHEKLEKETADIIVKESEVTGSSTQIDEIRAQLSQLSQSLKNV